MSIKTSQKSTSLLVAENRFFDQTIPALKNYRRICQAQDVFYFVSDGLRQEFLLQPPTAITAVKSFVIRYNFTAKRLLDFLYPNSWLTESQIVYYCDKYRDMLATSHWGNFFPLKVGKPLNGNISLISVYAHKHHGLAVYSHKLDEPVWDADFGFRLIKAV